MFSSCIVSANPLWLSDSSNEFLPCRGGGGVGADGFVELVFFVMRRLLPSLGLGAPLPPC
jgi:hypothetical protein